MEKNITSFTEEQKKMLEGLPEKERTELEKIYIKINSLQSKAEEKIAKEKERREKEVTEALEIFGKEFMTEYSKFNKTIAKSVVQFLKEHHFKVEEETATVEEKVLESQKPETEY